MDAKQIVDVIFSADKNIRYVGLTGPGPDYEVKASQMRTGVRALTSAEQEQHFIQFIPEIILGIADKLKDDLGRIGYALLCFQKVTLMLFKTPEYIVVLSLEAGTFARPIYERISTLLGLEHSWG